MNPVLTPRTILWRSILILSFRRTWERKVLRKIYDNGIWRIRTNKELMAQYQELDIVAEIKKARLR
jgi:hypothetical protein